MSARPKILSIGNMEPRVEDELARDFEIFSTNKQSLEEIMPAHAAEITGLITRGRMLTDARLIAELPRLQLIANYGVGYDSIDCAAAASRGVVVTNTPDVLNDEMADFTVGLMLATIREIPQSDAYLRAGNWERSGAFPLTASLRDRKIGIAGLGRIGQVIARRLQAFERPIAYYARTPRDGLPYEYHSSLEALAEAVDVLIVVLPGGSATHHAVNGQVLKKLGPNGILVNVARGSVADEEALIAALRDGTILGAGLDVFAHEPSVPQALREMKNVVLTPHVGTGTHHTRRLMGNLVIDNVRAWFAGKGPLTPVSETPWEVGANVA